MHFRKCFGYAACPLLAAFFFASAPLHAQAAPSPSPLSGTQAQQARPQQPVNSEQSVQILREAQERVNARRKQRVQQIVNQTYGHKYELSFGSGYLRFRPGSYLQHDSEMNWNVGFADFFHGNLGLATQFHGYYGVAYTGRNAYSVFLPSISQYTFLAGPAYRFYKGQHWGWTATALAGAGHGNFSTGTNGLPSKYAGLYNDSTPFDASLGASVDYNFSPTFAWQLTPTMLISRYGGQWQFNRGWDMGFVYRFGKQ